MSDFATALAQAVGPKLAPYVGAQADKWAEWLVQELNSKVIPSLPAQFQGAAAAAAKAIEGHRDLIQKVSAETFVSVVNHVAAGRDDAARADWLAGLDDDEAVLSLLDADNSAAQKAAQEREQHIATIEGLVRDLGPVLITILAHFI